MIYPLMASGVASPGDAVMLFLIGPVLVVMLILVFRLCFWIARMVGGIWNHFRPHQDLPPSLPPTNALGCELHQEPPHHDPANFLSLPEPEPLP